MARLGSVCAIAGLLLLGLSKAQQDVPLRYGDPTQPEWTCGPLDQDVRGTDIRIHDDIDQEGCRGLCEVDPRCTFIIYVYQMADGSQHTRCVLKENWNDGPDGNTGHSAGMTWCCNQNAASCVL